MQSYFESGKGQLDPVSWGFELFRHPTPARSLGQREVDYQQKAVRRDGWLFWIGCRRFPKTYLACVFLTTTSADEVA